MGGTSYRGTVEEGVYLFVVCYFGRRMELSFPETVLNSLHTCGASSSLCMVAFRLLRASALLEPVSVPPHGWPEPLLRHEGIPGVTPAGRDGSMWGRDATGPEPLLRPAGRGHRRPSPMRQTPLPNRPINKCGTGAGESSRERVFVSHHRFPSLFSANHAVVFGGLCVPTPTPAFIGLLKPYGGPSPPHWGFIVPTRDGGSLTLPYA